MDFRISKEINKFVYQHIDLDKETVKNGRSSRNWLLLQLESAAKKNIKFPPRYTEKHKGFGSFHRGTKKQPLDDIDQLFCFSAKEDMYYSEENETFTINISSDNKLYSHLASTTNKTKLSSIKMVNLIVNSLSDISQYKNIPRRNGEAATLQSVSYDWNFDIVPCFFTSTDSNGKDFYLIPDGNGSWKKTDPREDKKRSSKINQHLGGEILKLIRIVKYWNKRQTMSNMGSYLLENMILDYFETNKPSYYIEHSIRNILQYISNEIYNPVIDHKGIQGNLNTLTHQQKISISQRAMTDVSRFKEADNYEFIDKTKSIKQLKAIFGPNFSN